MVKWLVGFAVVLCVELMSLEVSVIGLFAFCMGAGRRAMNESVGIGQIL